VNKKIYGLVLVFSIVTIFTSQVWAMERRPAPKKESTLKTMPEVSKATGKVTGYSWSNSTITISAGNGNSLTVTSDKSTLISKARKYIKLSEIKTGDIVTVSYETKKGQHIAKSIVVQEKPTATSKSKR